MNEGIAGLGGPAIIILCHLNRSLSRSPRGERGLKCECKRRSGTMDHCRSPRGERGLKLVASHLNGALMLLGKGCSNENH